MLGKESVCLKSELDTLYAGMQDNVREVEVLVLERVRTLADQRRANEALENLKAEILLNGVIDGKNAEIRGAQLQRELVVDGRARAVVDAAAQAKTAVERIEAEVEVARLRYAAARERTRALVAWAELLGRE